MVCDGSGMGDVNLVQPLCALSREEGLEILVRGNFHVSSSPSSTSRINTLAKTMGSFFTEPSISRLNSSASDFCTFQDRYGFLGLRYRLFQSVDLGLKVPIGFGETRFPTWLSILHMLLHLFSGLFKRSDSEAKNSLDDPLVDD